MQDYKEGLSSISATRKSLTVKNPVGVGTLEHCREWVGAWQYRYGLSSKNVDFIGSYLFEYGKFRMLIKDPAALEEYLKSPQVRKRVYKAMGWKTASSFSEMLRWLSTKRNINPRDPKFLEFLIPPKEVVLTYTDIEGPSE